MPLIFSVGSLTVSEPATVFTDFLLTGLSWWFAYRLAGSEANIVRRWWTRAFVLIGAGAFAGGLWHGFHLEMPPLVDTSLWRACLLLALGSSYCLWQATAYGFPPAHKPEWWRRLGLLKALAGAIAALIRPEFVVVLADFAASMLFLAVRVIRAGTQPGARWLLAGVALFALGGIVQSAGLAPHPSFNHNDLFHVIQLGGNFLFYLGARRVSA